MTSLYKMASYLVLCDKAWFDQLSRAQQQAYLKEHPDSKLAERLKTDGDNPKTGAAPTPKSSSDSDSGSEEEDDDNDKDGSDSDEYEDEDSGFGELEDHRIDHHADKVAEATKEHPDVVTAAEDIKTGTASDDVLGKGSLALADAVIQEDVLDENMKKQIAVGGDPELGLAGALALVGHN